MADDFLAELFAYLHVLERDLVGAPRDPDRHHPGARARMRKQRKGALERAFRRHPFAVPPAEHVRFRHFDIIEEQFRGGKGAQPDRRDLAAFERRLPPLKHEMAESRGPFRGSVCASTTAMSATLPLLIQVFAPLITQWSPLRSARLRIPEGSE